MGVYIPSFKHANPAPGLNQPSSGAIAASVIGPAITGFATGITESAMQKKQLVSFADAVEIDDPQTAALLRAQAESIPFISGVGGGLAGGSSRSGGQSGVTNALLESSLTKLRDERLFRQRSELQAAEQQDALERIGASFQASKELENLRTQNDEHIKRLSDELARIEDPNVRELKEREFALESARVSAEFQRIGQAQQALENDIKDKTAPKQGKTQAQIAEEYLMSPASTQERMESATLFKLDQAGVPLPPSEEARREAARSALLHGVKNNSGSMIVDDILGGVVPGIGAPTEKSPIDYFFEE